MAYSEEDLIKAALLPDEDDEQVDEDKKPQGTTQDDDQGQSREEDDTKDKADDKKEAPEEDEDGDKVIEDDEDDKLTRKERREARQKSYAERVRIENEQKQNEREKLFKADPNYKPLDYNEQDEIDVKVLDEDRKKYGQQNFAKGVETERYYADQDTFWTRTEYEGKLLERDPKYAFLSDDATDEVSTRLRQRFNEKFLDYVGFNPDTKTVQRSDVSYDKWVQAEMEQLEEYASSRETEDLADLARQAGQTGIRPSGSVKSGIGKLRPGDISKMSDKDFEKYEAEIDRQIMSML